MAATGAGARFTSLQRLTRGGDIAITANADSTRLMVETSLSRLQLLLFETVPDDATVRFEVEGRGPSVPGGMHLGSTSIVGLAGGVSAGRDDALGLPDEFGPNRGDETAGIYAWWLPGGSHRTSASNVDLTPEEKSRLRALGYLQ